MSTSKKASERHSLRKTSNYKLFEMHPMNRNLHGDPLLAKSMQDYGFMPSSPLQCIRNGNGKLKIVRGHNRFANAKRLNLPVYYVIDDSCTDMFFLERQKQRWSVRDFAVARAKAGDKECAYLLRFQKKHELTLGSAASLVAGKSAARRQSQCSPSNRIKQGTFQRGDMKHARRVVSITDLCRELEIPFATSSSFVAAISNALLIPEFDDDRFKAHIRKSPRLMSKRSTRDEYLDELESAYNHLARGARRIPVAFRAKECLRASRGRPAK